MEDLGGNAGPTSCRCLVQSLLAFPLDSLRPSSVLSSLTVCSKLRFEAGSVDRISPYVPCLVRCESFLMCTPNLGLSMCTCRFLRSWRSLGYLLLPQGRVCLISRRNRIHSRKKGAQFSSKCLSEDPTTPTNLFQSEDPLC